MRDVSFCTGAFSDPRTRAYSERVLSSLLWALVYADESVLRYRPELPLLYRSGVRWKREEPRPGKSGCDGPGQEVFNGVTEVLRDGYADCEDLASWRVSELRLGRGLRRGPPPKPGHPKPMVCPTAWPQDRPKVDARPAFYSRSLPGGRTVYHIVVWWPDGYLEDPSRACGMGGFA